MVAKVTQYLQEVLAPTLDHFRVPATYASQIIDMVELQMISFLRHWDDLAFRRTLLLLGSEEGPFYEPAGKADVKCFIVVTLRNSPIELCLCGNAGQPLQSGCEGNYQRSDPLFQSPGFFLHVLTGEELFGI